MEKVEPIVHGPGLMGGLSGLVKNLFGLLMSRVELAAVELAQVRNHLIDLVTLFACAVLAAWFTIAFGAATIVAALWAAMGWKILLIMFLVFAVLTIGLVWKGMSMLKQGKLAFPETMNELKNDRDMLL